MDILKNPFHILGATTRDNRHSIMELAEERSLLSDADECMEARSTLIHPRRRISAEVAWLIGVDPVLSNEMLRHLDSPNQNLLNITGLKHITRANLLTTGLSRLSNLSSANLVEWILAIAQASEVINSQTVHAILNEDRRASGFPEITDQSAIDDEIRNQKRYYSQTITSILENLSVNARARVMTLLLETSTSNGRYQCPILIKDLIPAYELGVQDSLEQKQRIIEAQDPELRAMADATNSETTLIAIVDQLLGSVREWDALAQPIQLSQRSTGQRHDASFEMAWHFRKLAADLFREYQKPVFSRKILNTLKDVFSEVPEITEDLTEDLRSLEERIRLERSVVQFEEINTQVEKLKEAVDAIRPDYTLTPIVSQLIQVLKTWNTSIPPIEANNRVAIIVRNLALHLWNEHQKLDFAIQITETLIGVFRGVYGMNEVNNRLNEDIVTLYEMDQQRKKSNTGCVLQIVIFALLGLIGALLQGC